MYDVASPNKYTLLSENKLPLVRYIGGFAAGCTVYNFAQNAGRGVLSPMMADISHVIAKNITADEFKKVTEAVDNAIDISGLASKGVKILRADKNSSSSELINDILREEIDKNPIGRFLPKAYKKSAIEYVKNNIQNGKNALHASATKKIILPPKGKLPLTAFHEMGHAMNANYGTISKVLQRMRCVNCLAFPIAMIALLKDKKNDGEKPEGAVDKVTTFVKDNAGKLAFAAWVPALFTEGTATLKGNALAKKVLNPELAKKVAKSNAFGFSTYAIGATAAGLGAFAAKTIRDKIVHGEQQ